MRDQFDFFGIQAGPRRLLQREAAKGLALPTADDAERVALDLWDRPEREFQYCGADYLRAHVAGLDPDSAGTLQRLVTHKSWWDTVDELASDVAGPLVAAHPELRALMDDWLESDDIWLARSAILHQLRFKDRTDSDWLFAACLRHAGSKEFFLRKAIGWALREYSRTDPEAVSAFVARHEAELSDLSRREALRLIR